MGSRGEARSPLFPVACSLYPVAAVNEAQKLCSRACIVAEGAQHFACDHRNAALVHAASGHALMDGVDDDADTTWLENFVDAVSDLSGELLLDLEPSRVAVYHASKLADAHHLVGRQIANVRPTDDRRHVMLAMRLELDVAQDDHLIVAFDLFEGSAQVIGRVGGIA